MSNTAIADHALLSDRHSSALVDRSGSAEWLSFPRFDSPSVFGRLLSPEAGHWSITPSGECQRTPLPGPDAGIGDHLHHGNRCRGADRSTRTRAPLDRAIAPSDLLHAADRVDSWKQHQEEIWQIVIREAWSNEARAFTQSTGSTALDAANLMMAIVGFLPATDPRMLGTIDAIEERLADDRGLVYRYRNEDAIDGFAGEEGTFLLSSWSQIDGEVATRLGAAH
jgi:GH15 family glucan-1,4-alpha-glucosidase